MRPRAAAAIALPPQVFKLLLLLLLLMLDWCFRRPAAVVTNVAVAAENLSLTIGHSMGVTTRVATGHLAWRSCWAVSLKTGLGGDVFAASPFVDTTCRRGIMRLYTWLVADCKIRARRWQLIN